MKVTGPVCIVCDKCGDDLPGCYRTSGDAHAAAVSAGWQSDVPEDPAGNSFYDGSRHVCAACIENPNRNRDRIKSLLEQSQGSRVSRVPEPSTETGSTTLKTSKTEQS